MTCVEAQSLITPFINDKLDIATLEQFIDHVEKCKDCKEELEVYYAILTAMKQLDEDEEVSTDFAKELDHKLRESQELILKKKIIHIRKRVTFFLVVLLIGLFTSVSVSVVEEVLTVDEDTAFNSFVLQNEVLAPYMGDTLLDGMETYAQVQEEVERIEEEKKFKEELRKQRLNMREEAKRKKLLEQAQINALEAMNQDYRYPSTFDRTYEEATDWLKGHMEEKMNQYEENPASFDSLKEYSR